MTSSVPTSVLLDGFAVLMHFLLEAEADFLCGVSLYARSDKRTNYRSGYYFRKLSTPLGDVPLRVVHLKFFHPRVSLLKRAKRLSPSIFSSLALMHSNGVSPDQAAALIKSLWVIHLPDELLHVLTLQLVAHLEAWCVRVPVLQTITAGKPLPDAGCVAI